MILNCMFLYKKYTMSTRRIIRKKCIDLFTKHPQSVGETYCEHFTYAAKTGTKLIVCGCAAVIHAIFPFLCETFASDRIPALAKSLETRRK